MPKLKARSEELNAGVKLPSSREAENRRRGTIREEKQGNHQQSDFRRLSENVAVAHSEPEADIFVAAACCSVLAVRQLKHI